MKDVELVIFDWDGTVMDSVGKIVRSLQLAAQLHQRPVPAAEVAKQVIGLSLEPAMAMLFPDADKAEQQRLGESYKHAYTELDQTPTPLFTGAHDVFTQLRERGYQLAVATGKARRGLDRMWQLTDTGHFFTTSRCADEAESKPNPDMLWQITRQLQLAPEQAVMIGDSRFDMQMAQAAGCHRIGISHGVHNAEELAEFAPKTVVHSLPELLGWLPSR